MTCLMSYLIALAPRSTASKGNVSSSGLWASSLRNRPIRSATSAVSVSPLAAVAAPGIAGARVGRQQVPGPRDLDPAAIDRLEAAGPDRPGVGLLERDQLREMGQPHARLHLAGVVVLLLEDRRIDVGLRP